MIVVGNMEGEEESVLMKSIMGIKNMTRDRRKD